MHIFKPVWVAHLPPACTF